MSRLSRQDIKTLILAALGGALEFYDFIIFVFFTKTLALLFFPTGMASWLSQCQVYGIFAAGYLARPVGGIIMAHFGDLLGRKKMFGLSVFLMALPTLLIGLLPTYSYLGIYAPLLLLLLRILQGVAVGGEVPAAWVFVAEHVPKERVGFACASLTSGLTLGILLGSLVATSIYTQLSPAAILHYGWRIPFVVGGIFGFSAVWLRSWLKETPIFEAMKASEGLCRVFPLKIVIKQYWKEVILSMLVTWMLTASIIILILMFPTLVQTQFHINVGLAFKANNFATFTLVIGCLISGLLVDWVGYAKALFLGALFLCVITYLLYWDLLSGGSHFLILYSLAGFAVGVTGVIPSVLIAAFPPMIRFSGLSFSYNISYAFFGALTPPLVASLSTHGSGLATAHYMALTSFISMAIALKKWHAQCIT